MPPGFYWIIALVVILMCLGGVAAARAMQRRAAHKGESVAPPQSPPSEP